MTFNLANEVAKETARYLMRPSRNLTAHVDVVLNVAGGEWSGEAEVVYTWIPAFDGKPDEPAYGEHIEIHSCAICYTREIGGERKAMKLDIAGLVGADDDLHDAIQTQIIGE